MSVIISGIVPKSPADRAKIKEGDTLLTINQNRIDDVLDFRFYELESRLTLQLADKNGRLKTVKIKKDEFEDLGLLFETYLMDKQHSCKNKCIFCFIDQLPKNMRSSLYFKDDDSRLSFLFGNYITLTNITEHEIERIIKMHISPINVSVHTTNPELRVKMMANPRAREVMEILKRFSDADISINCQLVLCPEINDGDELVRSLADLKTLLPSLNSIALVPVGLTKHREGLFPLKPYTKEGARAVIETAEKFGNELLSEFGTRVVYPSDEFYLKAELPLPDFDFYEDFPQIENGVGLIRDFEKGAECSIGDIENSPSKQLCISFATGVDAAPIIRDTLLKLENKLPSVKTSVYAIQNDFFGHSITVAGLVTATDIIAQLKNKDLGTALVLPDVMLRHENDKFLDNLTVKDIETALNIPVYITASSGEGLIDTVLKIIEEKEAK